jgi:hypothetical protein
MHKHLMELGPTLEECGEEILRAQANPEALQDQHNRYYVFCMFWQANKLDPEHGVEEVTRAVWAELGAATLEFWLPP